MGNDKVNKLVAEIKELKVSELLEAFNGIIIILPDGNFFTSKDSEPPMKESKFDVILYDPGAHKAAVIRLVNELTGLGLKEAKKIVDNAPHAIKTGISKDEAEAITKQLKELGALVRIN